MNRTNKTTKKRLGIPILDNTKTGVCNQKHGHSQWVGTQI